MIQSIIRMTIPPQKSPEALKIVRRLVEQCRVNPDCHSCHLYVDLLEENFFMLEEIWKDRRSSTPSHWLRRIPQPARGHGDGARTAGNQVRHHPALDRYGDHCERKKLPKDLRRKES